MDIERLVEEYLNQLDHSDRLKAKVEEIKQALNTLLIEDGEVDDKGNVYLPVGKYLLQRQRRESKPALDAEKAVEWAQALGIWDKVSREVRVLDEDALVGYVFENRHTEGLEESFQELFSQPKVTFAFIRPTVVNNYEY